MAKFISRAEKLNIPYFGIGSLILNFSKLLPKSHTQTKRSTCLDDDYYKRIEAIQFTMVHDDGKKTDDISHADIVYWACRTMTPTSIYLSIRGFKTVNIPLVLKQKAR